MTKWYGKIGYMQTIETKPGVWTESIVERPYTGDITSLNKSWQQTSQKLNDDVELSIQLSIVADPFAYSNLSSIRYITYMGNLWKVKSITPEFPRLALAIGGVYNGPKTESSD